MPDQHTCDFQPLGFTIDPTCGGLKPTDRCACGAILYPYELPKDSRLGVVPSDFEDAMHSDNPFKALREAVIRRRDRGQATENILKDLDGYLELLRAQNRGTAVDVVLEVTDLLEGWCSPHVSIQEE